MMHRLILASASPRRRELLQLLGVPFTVRPAAIDETPAVNEWPASYVARLALEKAQAVFALTHGHEPATVLGADTTVVHAQRMMAKPASVHEARAMLTRLSGCTHTVWTGVALVSGEHSVSRSVSTEVEFHALPEALVARYVATGEPFDKAGGYGIQGCGARLVRSLRGSYHNVVGLPVDLTADLLEQMGFSLWQQSCL